MISPLDTLRQAVLSLAGNKVGPIASALPELWFARLTKPVLTKRVEARMVTLAVILQGEKKVAFGERELSYDAGSYLFVTGEHRYTATIEDASEAAPYLSLSLLLSPEQLASTVFALNDAGMRFDEPPDVDADTDALVAKLTEPILSALIRLVASLEDPISRRVLAPTIERELLVHLLRSPSGDTLRRAAAVDDARIRQALEYLTHHFGERVSVESIARRVAMSPSHFAHRFRAIVRMSPMQYVKHLRLQRARLLMLGEGLRAAEAAEAVGYGSSSHFTRDFKARFGSPPAMYVRDFRPNPS